VFTLHKDVLFHLPVVEMYNRYHVTICVYIGVVISLEQSDMTKVTLPIFFSVATNRTNIYNKTVGKTGQSI